MKKFCSVILVLAACLALTVTALAAETPEVGAASAPVPEVGAAIDAVASDEVGAYGYAVNPWNGTYVYTTAPWIANSSYIVRPWNSNYTYVASSNYTYPSYYYSSIWSNREGLGNFQLVKAYSSGSTYQDVPAGAWYETGVKTLYERGLLNDGKKFNPNGGLTLGEVVSMAVRIHSIYNNWTIPAGMGELQYALNVGIVTAGQYDNYNDPATRRSFAAIMAKALPSSVLRGVNSVLDGAITDVPVSDPGASGIYTLYRAGVLWNNNAWGTFGPNERITRASAAVITARLLDPSQRVTNNSLSVVQPTSVSLSQTSATLYPGETRTLSAYVYPDTAANRSVYWSSSDYSVATVDSYGVITAHRPGTTVITAATATGAVATCTVRVTNWY